MARSVLKIKIRCLLTQRTEIKPKTAIKKIAAFKAEAMQIYDLKRDYVNY